MNKTLKDLCKYNKNAKNKKNKKTKQNNFGRGTKISQFNFWVYNLHENQKKKMNILMYST
jgi:hypothetical protein